MIIPHTIREKFPQSQKSIDAIEEFHPKLEELLESMVSPKELKWRHAYELIYIESAKYRLSNLAHSTIQVLRINDLISTITLLRALFESICILGFFLRYYKKPSWKDKFKKLFFGQSEWEDFVKNIHIKDAIDATSEFIDKQVTAINTPALEKIYNRLSNFAHPNAQGTVFFFSNIENNKKETTISVEFSPQGKEEIIPMILEDLSGTLCMGVAILEHVNKLASSIVPSLEQHNPPGATTES